MDKKEKLKLQLAIDQADTWAKQYHKVINERSTIKVAAAQALKTLRYGIVSVEVDGKTYSVLPLGAQQLGALGDLARFVQLAPISAADQESLHQLETEVPLAIRDAGRVLTARRIDDESADAAEFIGEYVPWGLTERIPALLAKITPAAAAPQVDLANALSPAYGLGNALKSAGTAELIPANDIRSRLATFTAAERYADLARSITSAHEYVVVCSPTGVSASGLLDALQINN